MTIKLVGRDDIALTAANSPNYLRHFKFTAVATGNVTEIRFRVAATTAGNVAVGMYADSGGVPAALLGQKAVAVSSGAERVITQALDSAIHVVNGTDYWLSQNSDADLIGVKAEASVQKYKSFAYAPLPDPAGAGYSDDTSNNAIMAGWGTESITYDETGKLQVVLAVTGETDSLVEFIQLGLTLGYLVELHHSDGKLISILQNASGIGYVQEINSPHTLKFTLPADDEKLSDITLANEIWLRDYKNQNIMRKFILQRKVDERT